MSISPITAGTPKITDEPPVSSLGSAEETVSFTEVCDILSISAATAKNWIRLGKLLPPSQGTRFDRQYIQKLCRQLQSGENPRLKSRRNKRTVTGAALYKTYISNPDNQHTAEAILSSTKSITEEKLRILLANFAVQLYYESLGSSFSSCQVLSDYLSSAPVDQTFYSLITDLLGTALPAADLSAGLEEQMNYRLLFIPAEDTLGFIYLSLRDLGHRKSSGAYYTPTGIVQNLIKHIEECGSISEKTFCDPCCGTGNFLISLVHNGVPLSSLYGQDIDEISVQIARINLFLLCRRSSLEELYTHISCRDSLQNTSPDQFDIILGNPPWGSAFSREEMNYLHSHYVTARTKGMESFTLFIEKALSMLTDHGLLAFVLPESILSVSSHMEIRKLLFQKCSFNFVSFLGNIFPGVQCPAILLGATLDFLGSTVGCKVTSAQSEFTIMQQRSLENAALSFHIPDEEQECLTAISSLCSAAYLKDHAVFALGIVTGNNKDTIVSKPSPGYEIILRGCDIQRYHIKQAGNYIRFRPECFQQTAPAGIYRAPEKLLYRFISEVPVFAYDNAQTLSLNSCNILIPQINGLHIKYVLAILNSSVAAYYLSKRFHSVKLLRSHLEQLPIPVIPIKEQEAIIQQVERIMQAREHTHRLYCELDAEIMQLYHLNPEYQELIRHTFTDKNLYLAGHS